MTKKILYVSTNDVWSGSEELWVASAKKLIEIGYSVSIAVKYNHSNLEQIRDKLTLFIEPNKLRKKERLLKRVLNKVTKSLSREVSTFVRITSFKPDFVIISQGNNISSADWMELCVQNNFPFITITQLVAEVHLLFINDNHLSKLKLLYNKAQKNYFVSKANLSLHDFWFGINKNNNEVIYNPFKVKHLRKHVYPDTREKYKVAYVGRLECFHKGLDILAQIISKERWKQRAVEFNFYGLGPHENLLKDIFNSNSVNNVNFHGYTVDITNVWEKNHILILPSRMEGQSLSLIEALQHERTAIVTDVGGASEIIEDNVTGFIAESATIRDLDEAMERAWKQRGNWREIGIKAHDKINKMMPTDAVEYFNTKITKALNTL